MTILTLFALTAAIAEDPPRALDKIEAAIKASPDDPLLHHEKCRALFAKGEEQAAIDHAATAIAKFKAAKNDLKSMPIGTFKAGDRTVRVVVNMGRKEREAKKDGIVRPYSFHVLSDESKPKVVRTLDFEQGYFEGSLVTAAVGEMIDRSHANLGVVDPKSDFAAVKKRIVELLKE
jgi:hypothetical protein